MNVTHYDTGLYIFLKLYFLKHIVILYLLPLKEHKQCIPISFIIPGREKDMLRLGHETEDSFYIKKLPISLRILGGANKESHAIGYLLDLFHDGTWINSARVVAFWIHLFSDIQSPSNFQVSICLLHLVECGASVTIIDVGIGRL